MSEAGAGVRGEGDGDCVLRQECNVNIGVVPTKPGVTQDDMLAGGRQKHEADGLPVTPR